MRARGTVRDVRPNRVAQLELEGENPQLEEGGDR
jgi:hypothetical protein